MVDSLQPKARCFHATPGCLLLVLLAIEGLLWLSERFRWFAFNQHKGWTVLIAAGVVGAAVLLMFLWFAASLLFRWRFQFTIRSLLVLTVAAGLPCSWLAVHGKKAREQRQAREAITKAGGALVYDYQLERARTGVEPKRLAWLVTLLGDDFFADVVSGNLFTDAQMEPLDGLPQLQDLSLCHRPITDAGLAHLSRLTQLRTLELQSTRITDAGLAHLSGLTRLEKLLLEDNEIGDVGLAHLSALSEVEVLWLGGTAVTSAGLAHLSSLAKLQSLGLDRTLVTDTGLIHLSGLTQLQDLSLDYTRITDAALSQLSGFTQLRQLSLSRTQITDAGLTHLSGLTGLKDLSLGETMVTDGGFRKLQQSLPDCYIGYVPRAAENPPP